MNPSLATPAARFASSRLAALLLALGASCVSIASAATLAHWRFEEGAVGDQLQANFGSAITTSPDSSGNGYSLQAYNTNGTPNTAPIYSASTPFGSGGANNRSFRFDGNDDLYSQGATGLNSITSFTALTIEASVNFGDLGGYQTFLGKDGFNIPGAPDANLASVYFQLVQDGGFANHVAIKLHTGNGAFVGAYTAAPVIAGQWYNFSAVFDGSNLSLYSVTGGIATLEGSASFVGPVISQDNAWTVGRGMYAGNVGDWVKDGTLIDEVRISDAALTPGEFIAVAIPEPSTFAAMGGLAGLFFAASRRRRA
jgi:hypothetical protein